METCQKTIRTSLAKYGSLNEIIKQNGVLVIIDSAIQTFLEIVSKRFYRPNGTDYGLREVFFAKSIDQFERYAFAVKEIQKMNAAKSILEIGAGGKGISSFSNLLKSNCDFFLFDIKKDSFNGLKNTQAIVGDGCKLPFRDKIFDVIVSVDAVEHIPKSIRNNFYQELKRVCKKKVIITCPLQSSDDAFQGNKYDIIFQYFHECDFGVKEPNTKEHIASIHPSAEEIKKEFPNSTISGYKNCDIWLNYMVFSHKPITGLFCGMLYYLFWKKDSYKPPYWGAIITSNIERII